MKLISFLNSYFFGPVLPVILFCVGIFYLIKLRRFHIFTPSNIFRALRSNSGTATSPFKAMTVALAGTLGVGNIAGVAAAISTGGAGAIFWMWISAIVAMILKYAETVLAVKHRRVIIENGRQRNTGGAFMYMSDCGNKKLGLCFALLCVITSISMGSIVQSNAISVSLTSSFGFDARLCGIILAILTLIVISGGFSKISEITYFAVPLFCLIYTGISLYVIFANIGELPGVIARIITEAFSLKCAGSGVMGYGIMRAMRYGVARGILSNEAGSGTSVCAHAASDTSSPAAQGAFGIFEVFIDTIVLCSMTAFVILLSGECKAGDAAMVVAIKAYGKFIGKIAPGFMSVAVTFFAFATIMCWSVYGAEALRYISSEHLKRLDFKRLRFLYYVFYSLSVLAGTLISGDMMWELSDMSCAVMTLINTGFLATKYKEVKKESAALFK
ncbi:MAG: sodium:alanine symporter family protein [Clostridia bacterium]|nr:sodium:alanine symporter family protein [Clostridia bacterium]